MSKTKEYIDDMQELGIDVVVVSNFEDYDYEEFASNLLLEE